MSGTHVHQDLLRVERSCQVLGADASIHLAVPPDQLLEACAALDTCLDWLSEVDQRLTPADPASELSRVNARAGRWQPVSALLLAVVQEALRQSLASAGRFDPTLDSAREASGAARERSRSLGGWRAIQLDPKHRCLYLPAGLQLHLHGLANGWAADVVGQQLSRSFANVLVTVGGTLVLHGRQTRYTLGAAGLRTPPSQPLASPPPERAAITVRQGGLATECASASEWAPQHQWQHTRDSRPLPSALLWHAPEAAAPDKDSAPPRMASATALARTAARAEVAALIALQRGYPEAVRMVESAWRDDRASRPHLAVDQSVALLLVLEGGEVVCSEQLEAYLERCAGGKRQ